MLILDDRRFIESAFDSENELEKVVVDNSEYLFGPASIYLPKALIRTKGGFGTIPDGFAIDLESGQWFIVEAELHRHSVWSHIAPQVAKQLIAATNPASRQLLIDLAVEQVKDDTDLLEKFSEQDIDVIDIRRVLGDILEKDPVIGMPIDGITNDLRDWARTLKVTVNLWIVKKYAEFGHPETVLFEIPEQFLPAVAPEVEKAEEKSSLARYNVGLTDLIGADLLKVGEKLYMGWKPRTGEKKIFEGTILPTGEIEVLGKPFSPSYAAVYALQTSGSARKTENGWMKWKNADGKFLADLRDMYLAKQRIEKASDD